MKKLTINSNEEVKEVFKTYPSHIRKKILYLRKLILETAKEITEITDIEETLKWGEPSYITKHGSTLRIAWKEKAPNQYAIYFKCTSKLVATFKTVFKDTFTFDDKRAIVFQTNDNIPEAELKQCISATLQYHKVKNKSKLGLEK